jgi:hypothetical protein
LVVLVWKQTIWQPCFHWRNLPIDAIFVPTLETTNNKSIFLCWADLRTTRIGRKTRNGSTQITSRVNWFHLWTLFKQTLRIIFRGTYILIY